MADEHDRPAVADYRVKGGIDPSLMPRVIEIFAQRGVVPLELRSRRRAEDLVMHLHVDGIDAGKAARIEQAVRARVLVESVKLRMKRG